MIQCAAAFVGPYAALLNDNWPLHPLVQCYGDAEEDCEVQKDRAFSGGEKKRWRETPAYFKMHKLLGLFGLRLKITRSRYVAWGISKDTHLDASRG